jgi:phenylalanyl-tRNA synthetase beta chain
MLISYKWLFTYLPGLDAFTYAQIAQALTESLAEVEGFRETGKGISKIMVGEVTATEPHPTHKKLKVCTVSNGKNETTIICGANNVAAGQKVAVCLPGGSVLNAKQALGSQESVKIEARQIGTITSNGMICSAKELGLSEDHEGILVLEPEAKLGTDLTELLQDVIFEIENKSLSHRPDCFSHFGIVRELSAILKLNIQLNSHDVPIIPSTNLPISVQVKVNQDLCSRFTALVIKDVKVKSSPLWLQFRLSSVGVRPINNIVDITNFVMLDQGQPMHAFDYDLVENNKLIVRKAHAGEKIKALDAKEYELENDMVVVGDSKQAESIAGIMGGEATEINLKTKNVILEAATWDMYNIRRTSRKLSIRTEASTRFEKGQDPENTVTGIKRATELILDVCGGEIASEISDFYPEPRKPRELGLEIAMVKRFLGLDLNKNDIISHLESLGLVHLSSEKLSPNEMQQNIERFEIPTFRPDLKIPQDLLEEIARLHGYDGIPVTLPKRDLQPVTANPVSLLSRRIKALLTSLGLDESMTYSFVGSELYEMLGLDIKNCLAISNPLSPELGFIRNTLVPSLISKVNFNAGSFDHFGLFEINRATEREIDPETTLHRQPLKLAILIYQNSSGELYSRIKGVADQLLENLEIPATYSELPRNSKDSPLLPLMHPGRSAQIRSNEANLGVIGELHPSILHKMELKAARIAVCELDFTQLLENYHADPEYHKLSDFQEVFRDLSIWFSNKVKYADVMKQLAAIKSEIIKEIVLTGTYESAKGGEKLSYTFRISLQSGSKTLTENEINQAVEQATTVLTKAGGELRKS